MGVLVSVLVNDWIDIVLSDERCILAWNPSHGWSLLSNDLGWSLWNLGSFNLHLELSSFLGHFLLSLDRSGSWTSLLVLFLVLSWIFRSHLDTFKLVCWLFHLKTDLVDGLDDSIFRLIWEHVLMEFFGDAFQSLEVFR